MTVIMFDRENDNTEVFVSEATKLMELDMKVLAFKGDDSTGISEYWDNSRHRYFRNLCYFVALGGVLSTQFKQALAEKRLYSYEGYDWCDKEGLDLPKLDPSKNLDWENTFVICDYNKLKSKDKRELLTILVTKGLTVLTLNNIYAAKVAESIVTEEDFVTYLRNIGAKYVSGCWEVKFKKYTVLKLEFDKDNNCWVYHEGTQQLKFRNFYAINGQPIYNSPHKIALLALNYLLTAFDETDLKGRRAYMAGVFVDIISVGYEHKLLDKFNRNKVGHLKIGVKSNNWLPLIIEDGDMLQAAIQYEKLGFSVFMHKGAKYITVDAGMTGFGRKDDKTQVAWFADKQAKLTGRALWNVPSAAEYIDDDED